MDIEKQRCVDAFEALGLEKAASYFGDYGQKGPFMALERGDISVEDFHAALRQGLPADVSDAAIDTAFCKFLIGIPVARLRQLEELGRRYNVYLLSNTNAVMWHSTIADEFRKDGHEINHYFKGLVTSFEANALKPEEKIFRYCEQKLGIVPEETLFFDDSKVNLEAAARLGFHTVLVNPGDEFAELLAKYLNYK